MTIKLEHYDIGVDGNFAPGDNWWAAQTFTPFISHELTQVVLYMSKQAAPNVTITIDIYACDGEGKPVGEALGSGTFLSTTIPTVWVGFIPASYTWMTIALSAQLTMRTMYAIVMHCPDPGGANVIFWGYDGSLPTYFGGTHCSSNNSGDTWSVQSGADFLFEEWGSLLSPADQTVIGNKVSLEAIRNLEIVYGGRFYIDKSGNAVYESRYHRNV